MKERKWHFGTDFLVWHSTPSICGHGQCPDSLKEWKKQALQKDRCKHCTSAMPKLSKVKKTNGFWFRRRES